MNNTRKTLPLLAVIVLLGAGCTTIPTGPSRMALPGTGKNFDQFKIDDGACREYALQVLGATPTATQENAAVRSTVAGTAIGAAAGAAIGSTSSAAGVGAGVGLLMGAMIGAAAGDASGQNAQRRYDNGYTQCMYAKGHRVAVPAQTVQQYQRPAPQLHHIPPPAPAPQPQVQAPAAPYYPPPPPGSPPPPPSAILR
ncbi:MAG: hypothetical protein FJY56_02955 [Betaproteobacteria bacterium]|nr:hypothetical protein [Betaproteobacteria bacterium]